jgi:hypothetical protein
METFLNDFLGYAGEAVMLFCAGFILILFFVSLRQVMKTKTKKGEKE